MSVPAHEVSEGPKRQFSSELATVLGETNAVAKSKAAFLTNIGHEIRTPLNGVLGLASLLKATDLDLTQRRYVETIERSSEALMGVLSNLLEYAHLESGTLPLAPGPIQIAQLAVAAISTVQSAATAKGIELRTNLGEGAISVRTGDQDKVLHILSHLLNNAVKFTQGGVVTLSIDRIGEDSEGVFRMSVEDTGIGMTDVELNAIISGVTSLPSAETATGGVGLGLLISQKLAKLMGARLEGKSVFGVGSCFTLQIAMGPDLAMRESASPEVSSELAGLKVLVVEENSNSNLVLSAILSHSGADVTSVADGKCAVQAAKLEHFDAILMDLVLPVMDGIHATRAIRDLGGYCSRVPIIGVSSGLTELDRWACTQSGMNGLLLKPLTGSSVIETLLNSPHRTSTVELSLGRPA